uniref:Uncharacterized protein n=1 Tax=Edwardsiella tarda TaxID=636 RepID=A0A2S1PMD9_EDWTA|nr:hypothetical protein [Edwardsiella tarda]
MASISIYHEEVVLKKWILKMVCFLICFSMVTILVFELSFRLFSADFFIRLLEKLSLFGFKSSFDSLVIFLTVLSLIVSFLLCIAVVTIIKKRVL